MNNIEISPIAVSQVYKPADTIGDIGETTSDIIISHLFDFVKPSGAKTDTVSVLFIFFTGKNSRRAGACSRRILKNDRMSGHVSNIRLKSKFTAKYPKIAFLYYQ